MAPPESSVDSLNNAVSSEQDILRNEKSIRILQEHIFVAVSGQSDCKGLHLAPLPHM